MHEFMNPLLQYSLFLFIFFVIVGAAPIQIWNEFDNFKNNTAQCDMIKTIYSYNASEFQKQTVQFRNYSAPIKICANILSSNQYKFQPLCAEIMEVISQDCFHVVTDVKPIDVLFPVDVCDELQKSKVIMLNNTDFLGAELREKPSVCRSICEGNVKVLCQYLLYVYKVHSNLVTGEHLLDANPDQISDDNQSPIIAASQNGANQINVIDPQNGQLDNRKNKKPKTKSKFTVNPKNTSSDFTISMPEPASSPIVTDKQSKAITYVDVSSTSNSNNSAVPKTLKTFKKKVIKETTVANKSASKYNGTNSTTSTTNENKTDSKFAANDERTSSKLTTNRNAANSNKAEANVNGKTSTKSTTKTNEASLTKSSVNEARSTKFQNDGYKVLNSETTIGQKPDSVSPQSNIPYSSNADDIPSPILNPAASSITPSQKMTSLERIDASQTQPFDNEEYVKEGDDIFNSKIIPENQGIGELDGQTTKNYKKTIISPHIPNDDFDDSVAENPMEGVDLGGKRLFLDKGDSHFFLYFMLMVAVVFVGYVAFHNKQKIFALIVEGRHERRRRPRGAEYRKLEAN